jgi:DNA-binding response OmpR family regulator
MNMPIMSGKEFLVELRKYDKHLPVLVLTSNSLLGDKLEAFDIGADDYLTKPFESAELIARVKALTKRQRMVIIDEVRIRDVNVDLTHGKIYKRGKEVELGAKEYKIIAYLATTRGVTHSKDEILEAVW